MPFQRSPLSLLLQRLIVRTGRTPLRWLWRLLHRASAWAFLARLMRGERSASAYVRHPGADFLPGLSDVDLLVVLGGDEGSQGGAAARLRQRARRLRWGRFGRLVPLVDDPLVLGAGELRALVGRSALTYGLDHRDGHAAVEAPTIGTGATTDVASMLIRPGLYGSLPAWEPHRRARPLPPEPTRDEQDRHLAGWLELVFWWSLLGRACMHPAGSRPTDACVKAVAESLRVWSWLANEERLPSRLAALEQGPRLLPDEAEGLHRILELRRSADQWDRSSAPLTWTLPLLVRLARRVADVIDLRAKAAGCVEVRLRGGDRTGLIVPPGHRGSLPSPTERVTGILPLLDWRGIVSPLVPDDTFVGVDGGQLEAHTLLAAAAVTRGPYPTLVADGLLIRPGSDFRRSRLRAIECPTTDPMSFALIDGASTASFAELGGWSAADVARRAIFEHRPWVHEVSGPLSAMPPGQRLGMLLSAGRAAVFYESLSKDPELPLTLADGVRALPGISVAAALAAEDGLEHYLAFVASGREPPESVLAELSRALRHLPAYDAAVRWG